MADGIPGTFVSRLIIRLGRSYVFVCENGALAVPARCLEEECLRHAAVGVTPEQVAPKVGEQRTHPLLGGARRLPRIAMNLF